MKDNKNLIIILAVVAVFFLINNQTSQQAIVDGAEEEIVDIIHPSQELDTKKEAIIDCATAGGGCVDSDGGLNYYVKGNVCLFSKSYPDECLDDETLKEYYCKAGAPFSKKVTQSGYTCVYSKLGRCTDSDGGKYPKDYGVVTSANGVKYEDYCVGTDSVKVKEYSCGADNAVIGTTMTLSGYECDGGELVKTDDECTPEATYSCYSKELYYYDSCGNRGDMKTNCPEDCKDDKCVSADDDDDDNGGGGNGGGDDDLGEGQEGDKCSDNADCESAYCDKSNWYSISSTCQKTPWYLTKKIAQSKDDISEMTTNAKLAIACIDDKECIPQKEGDSAKCISLAKLEEEGVLGVNTGFFDSAQDTIDSGISGGLVGGAIGGAVCIGGSAAAVLLTGGAAAVGLPAMGAACTFLINGGAVLGAWKGITTNNDKDPLVKALKAKNTDSVGLCVSQEDGGGGSACSFFEKFAFNQKILGDECTTGAIFFILMIFIGFAILGNLR